MQHTVRYRTHGPRAEIWPQRFAWTDVSHARPIREWRSAQVAFRESQDFSGVRKRTERKESLVSNMDTAQQMMDSSVANWNARWLPQTVVPQWRFTRRNYGRRTI